MERKTVQIAGHTYMFDISTEEKKKAASSSIFRCILCGTTLVLDATVSYLLAVIFFAIYTELIKNRTKAHGQVIVTQDSDDFTNKFFLLVMYTYTIMLSLILICLLQFTK